MSVNVQSAIAAALLCRESQCPQFETFCFEKVPNISSQATVEHNLLNARDGSRITEACGYLQEPLAQPSCPTKFAAPYEQKVLRKRSESTTLSGGLEPRHADQ